MIFLHKSYYNPNYTNLNKNNLSDICPKPKKLYKVYKLYNVTQNFKNIYRKKIETKF